MKASNTKFSPKTYIQTILYDKVEVKRGKKLESDADILADYTLYISHSFKSIFLKCLISY